MAVFVTKEWVLRGVDSVALRQPRALHARDLIPAAKESGAGSSASCSTLARSAAVVTAKNLLEHEVFAVEPELAAVGVQAKERHRGKERERGQSEHARST